VTFGTYKTIRIHDPVLMDNDKVLEKTNRTIYYHISLLGLGNLMVLSNQKSQFDFAFEKIKSFPI